MISPAHCNWIHKDVVESRGTWEWADPSFLRDVIFPVRNSGELGNSVRPGFKSALQGCAHRGRFFIGRTFQCLEITLVFGGNVSSKSCFLSLFNALIDSRTAYILKASVGCKLGKWQKNETKLYMRCISKRIALKTAGLFFEFKTRKWTKCYFFNSL